MIDMFLGSIVCMYGCEVKLGDGIADAGKGRVRRHVWKEGAPYGMKLLIY